MYSFTNSTDCVRESSQHSCLMNLFPNEPNRPLLNFHGGALLKAAGEETSHSLPQEDLEPSPREVPPSHWPPSHWPWEERRQGFKKETCKAYPGTNSETMLHPILKLELSTKMADKNIRSHRHGIPQAEVATRRLGDSCPRATRAPNGASSWGL